MPYSLQNRKLAEGRNTTNAKTHFDPSPKARYRKNITHDPTVDRYGTRSVWGGVHRGQGQKLSSRRDNRQAGIAVSQCSLLCAIRKVLPQASLIKQVNSYYTLFLFWTLMEFYPPFHSDGMWNKFGLIVGCHTRTCRPRRNMARLPQPLTHTEVHIPPIFTLFYCSERRWNYIKRFSVKCSKTELQ